MLLNDLMDKQRYWVCPQIPGRWKLARDRGDQAHTKSQLTKQRHFFNFKTKNVKISGSRCMPPIIEYMLLMLRCNTKNISRTLYCISISLFELDLFCTHSIKKKFQCLFKWYVTIFLIRVQSTVLFCFFVFVSLSSLYLRTRFVWIWFTCMLSSFVGCVLAVNSNIGYSLKQKPSSLGIHRCSRTSRQIWKTRGPWATSDTWENSLNQ